MGNSTTTAARKGEQRDPRNETPKGPRRTPIEQLSQRLGNAALGQIRQRRAIDGRRASSQTGKAEGRDAAALAQDIARSLAAPPVDAPARPREADPSLGPVEDVVGGVGDVLDFADTYGIGGDAAGPVLHTIGMFNEVAGIGNAAHDIGQHGANFENVSALAQHGVGFLCNGVELAEAPVASDVCSVIGDVGEVVDDAHDIAEHGFNEDNTVDLVEHTGDTAFDTVEAFNKPVGWLLHRAWDAGFLVGRPLGRLAGNLADDAATPGDAAVGLQEAQLEQQEAQTDPLAAQLWRDRVDFAHCEDVGALQMDAFWEQAMKVPHGATYYEPERLREIGCPDVDLDALEDRIEEEQEELEERRERRSP